MQKEVILLFHSFNVVLSHARKQGNFSDPFLLLKREDSSSCTKEIMSVLEPPGGSKNASLTNATDTLSPDTTGEVNEIRRVSAVGRCGLLAYDSCLA